MPEFLVIGGGSIGRKHAGNLLASGVSVAVVEPHGPTRAIAEKTLGAKTFFSLEAALKKDFAAALVCTPTSMHASHAHACLEAGLPTFIEKPVSDKMDGIPELARLAEKKKLPVLVGCNLRFLECLRRAKQLLDAGAIGRVFEARVDFGFYLPDSRPGQDYRKTYSAQKALGGGVVLDAIHELDYVRWLLGKEPQAVQATARKLSSLEMDVEDTAEITLDFGGSLAQIHLDYLQRTYGSGVMIAGRKITGRRTAQIIGEDGTLFVDIYRRTVRVDAPQPSDESFTAEDEGDAPYVREMRHFIDCVEGRAKPEQDLRQAASVLKTALAALESSEKGKRVKL